MEQIITVIYNCACVKANLVVFHDTDPVRVLLAFARCPNLDIRLLSKLTLSYLQSHVDRSTIQSALKLHTDEIQFIVENLHNAVVENFTGSGYSAEELLQGVVNLSEITENKSKLVNDTLFHTIDNLFGSHDRRSFSNGKITIGVHRTVLEHIPHTERLCYVTIHLVQTVPHPWTSHDHTMYRTRQCIKLE